MNHKSLYFLALIAATSATSALAAPELENRNLLWGTNFETNSSKQTRAVVVAEAQTFRRNPVSVDGQWRFVGGEQGWEVAGHALSIVNGQWVHTDKQDHSASKPSVTMTETEARRSKDIYTPG